MLNPDTRVEADPAVARQAQRPAQPTDAAQGQRTPQPLDASQSTTEPNPEWARQHPVEEHFAPSAPRHQLGRQIPVGHPLLGGTQ